MQIQDNTLNSIKEKMIDEVIEELMNMGYMTSLQKAAYKSEILSDIQWVWLEKISWNDWIQQIQAKFS